jgi:hypothetical protein
MYEENQYSQRWTSARKADLFGGAVRALVRATEDYQHHREKAEMKPTESLNSPISRIRP